MSTITPRGNSWALGLFVHSAVDDSDLTVYEFRVYAHLCRRAGDERRVWEGQKKIANACSISRAAAQKALYGLRDKGWIDLIEQFRDEDGSRKPNDIIICGPPAFVEGTPPPSTKAPPASEKGSIRKSTEGNPSEGNPPTPQGGLILPDWLSDEAWGDWLQHRKELKKPMTAIASQKLLAKLDRLRGQGHDPASLIDEAISNGWQSVYEPRVQKSSAGRPQTTSQANERFAARVSDGLDAIKGIFDD